jgi:hypothetical protein
MARSIPTQRGFLCFLTSTALALPLVTYRFLAQHGGIAKKRSNVKMPVLSARNVHSRRPRRCRTSRC